MKKVFLLALSLCLTLSFSGLNAADKTPAKQEAAKPLAYETDGTLTGTPYGNIAWHITYSGTTPLAITYTNAGTTYGPYSFNALGGSSFQAAGPRAIGIIYVIVTSGNPDFTTIF